eukprot:666787-Amphidinium_carterae.2
MQGSLHFRLFPSNHCRAIYCKWKTHETATNAGLAQYAAHSYLELLSSMVILKWVSICGGGARARR